MEDRFVKDFDLSFDNQLLVDYEIEIRNEIKSLLDDFKKENYLFYLEVNRQEAKFWVEIINKYSHFIKKEEKEKKFKRLSKIFTNINLFVMFVVVFLEFYLILKELNPNKKTFID